MANNYYNVSTTFIPGTKVRSDQVNTEYQALEAAFDLLPTDPDSLTGGVNTYAGASGGAGNAYTVTMPNTRLTNDAGAEVIFVADKTNTGAATLDVDGIGAVAMVRFDGQALTANDIQSGLIYVVRYDATNVRFQLIGPSTSYVTDAEDARDTSIAAANSAGNSANSASTSAGEAADSATSAEDWAIRVEDDPVPVSSGGDGSTTYSALHWASKSQASAVRGTVNTDIPTATPPTTEAVTGAYEIWDADDTDELMSLGYNAGNTVVLINRMRGGDIFLSGTRAAGSTTFFMVGNPDGDTSVYGQTSLSLFVGGSILADIDASDFNINSGTILKIYDNDNSDFAAFEHRDTDFDLDLTSTQRFNLIGANMVLDKDFVGGGNLAISLHTRNNGDSEIGWWDEADTFGEVYGFSQMFDTGAEEFIIRRHNNTGTGAKVMVIPRNTNEVRFTEGVGSLYAALGHDGTDFNIDLNGTTAKLNMTSGGNTLITADPSSGIDLYHSNVVRVATTSTGLAVRSDLSPGLGSNQDVRMLLQQADGESLARFGFFTQATLNIRNSNHGGNIRLDAEDALGVAQDMAILDPDGGVDLYYDGTLRAATGVSGDLNVYSDASTDAEGRFLTLRHQDGTARARFGFAANNSTLYMRGFVHGGVITIDGENNAGTPTTIFTGDPDGGATTYYAGTARLVTDTGGIAALRSDASTDTENRYLALEHADGTERGRVGYTGGSILELRNLVHGGNVRLRGEDAGGVDRTMVNANPDAETSLYYDNVETFRTADEDADDNNSGAEVRAADQTFYPVGFNVAAAKANPGTFSAAATWQDYAGHVIAKFNTTAFTATTPGSTDSVVKNGSMWSFLNAGASGDISISAGSGVTITWLDGSTPTTGNRTVGPGGAATLWKRNDTNWYMWGTGIS